MQVQVNGKMEEIHCNTVLDLLNAKNIESHMVAVELNSQMVERELLETTPIKEGDHLEFLFYMGGGR